MIYEWFFIADSILNIKSLLFNLHSITLLSCLLSSPNPSAIVLTSHQPNWKIVKQTFRSLLRTLRSQDGTIRLKRREINYKSIFTRSRCDERLVKIRLLTVNKSTPLATGIKVNISHLLHDAMFSWHGSRAINFAQQLTSIFSCFMLAKTFRMTKVIFRTERVRIPYDFRAQSWSSFDMLSP